MRTIKKNPYPRNAKEHYQSFIRKKHKKSVKQAEIITYFKNLNIVNKYLVITEYPKTLHKLSKTEKMSSNSYLYSDRKKVKTF